MKIILGCVLAMSLVRAEITAASQEFVAKLSPGEVCPIGYKPAIPFALNDPELAAALGLDRYIVGDNLNTLTHIRTEGIQSNGTVELMGDPFFTTQWGLNNTGQYITDLGYGKPGADISWVDAMEFGIGVGDPILAIIDSGVTPHEDLGEFTWGFNIVKFSDHPEDLTDEFNCQHGTHVAGIAAALRNNGLGIAGVCPGVKIMRIVVMSGNCQGNEVGLALGVLTAVNHGAKVINMSVGSYEGTDILRDACTYAWQNGCVLVGAAGNRFFGEQPEIAYPARFPEVIAVGATDNLDHLAKFSMYGEDMEITAPGAEILSTYPGNWYVQMNGTSMATPVISGAACLLWRINPELTNWEIRDILDASVDDLGLKGKDAKFGYGRLNLRKAVYSVYCSCDIDKDGYATIFDFLYFINAFNDEEGIADLDYNGILDIYDFLVFVNKFNECQ